MLEKMIDEIIKKQVLKEVTDNIGKIEINDHEINCYVDYEKLEQKQTMRNICLINVDGISKEKYGEQYLKECGLYDMKINYIFSNIYFHDKLCISSYGNTNLIFDNCTFTNAIQINHADNVIFKNNEYNVFAMYGTNGFIGTEFLISSSNKDNVKCVSFCDDKVIPSRKNVKVNKPLNLVLDLNAKKVKLIGTDFYDVSSMKIDCDELVMRCFAVDAEEMEITADKIVSDYNNDIFVQIVNIENKNKDYDIIMDTIFDTMFFNGVEIDKNIDCSPTDEMIALQKERVCLADALRCVYNKCNNDIDERTEEIRSNMKQKNIARVLKK